MNPVASTPNQDSNLQKEILSNERQRTAKLVDLHQQRSDAIRKVLGPHAMRYRQELTTLRQRLAALEKDCTDVSLRSQLRQEAIAESRKTLQGLGLDGVKIMDITRYYNNQIIAALQRPAEQNHSDLTSRGEITRLGEVTVGPQSRYSPPYFNGWKDGNNKTSADPGDPEVSLTDDAGVDPKSGQIWAKCLNTIQGNDEHNWAECWRNGEVNLKFIMPDFRGRVRAQIELLPEFDIFWRHRRWTTGGPFADSNSHTIHEGRIYLKVVDNDDIKEIPLSKGSSYDNQTDYEDDEEIKRVTFDTGQRPWYILYSTKFYDPKQELILGVGINNYDFFKIDDMRGYSGFENQWRVTNVSVAGVW